jgi:hypothetical protein
MAFFRCTPCAIERNHSDARRWQNTPAVPAFSIVVTDRSLTYPENVTGHEPDHACRPCAKNDVRSCRNGEACLCKGTVAVRAVSPTTVVESDGMLRDYSEDNLALPEPPSTFRTTSRSYAQLGHHRQKAFPPAGMRSECPNTTATGTAAGTQGETPFLTLVGLGASSIFCATEIGSENPGDNDRVAC